jgi:arylsulfatase A-like enzyme
VLSGPGFRGGGQLQELVSLIDLPPTLLDAAGLEVPAPMQGRSLLPLLHGRDAEWPEEVFVQISEAQTGRAVRTKRWKYGVDAPGEKGSWAPVFTEQYLYDLQADPYELANLVASEAHRPVAELMRDRLLRRMAQAGEQRPEIESADVQPRGQRRVSAEEALQ